MTLVRIVTDGAPYDLLRQTPDHSGVWEDVTFTLDEVDECDYVICFSYPQHGFKVKCPPNHVWMIVREPPVGWAKHWSTSQPAAARVYTTDTGFSGWPFIQSHPALPWLVERDYDFLSGCKKLKKTQMLSWVTSSVNVFPGHGARLEFLRRTRDTLQFDLFGRGFSPLDDKWDGLAPYRYSLAVENFCNGYYWSEKISDCFLAWTMPIYYGCTRIADYFPEESFISIDIGNPNKAAQVIRQAIEENLWEKNLDAIAHARELVMERYQIFPFVVDQIRESRSRNGFIDTKQTVQVLPRPEGLAPLHRLSNRDLFALRRRAFGERIDRVTRRLLMFGLRS